MDFFRHFKSYCTEKNDENFCRKMIVIFGRGSTDHRGLMHLSAGHEVVVVPLDRVRTITVRSTIRGPFTLWISGLHRFFHVKNEKRLNEAKRVFISFFFENYIQSCVEYFYKPYISLKHHENAAWAVVFVARNYFRSSCETLFLSSWEIVECSNDY